MSDQLEKGILSLNEDSEGLIIDEENNAELKDDEDINKELGDKGALSDAATFGEAAAPEEAAATFGEAAAPEEAAAPDEAVALIQPEVEVDEEEPPPPGTDAPTLQEIVMKHAENLSQEDQKDPEGPIIIDFGSSEDLSEDITIPYMGKQDTSMNDLQKEVSRHTKELELLRQIVKFLLKNKKTKKKPRNKRKKSHTSKKKKSVKKPRKTVKKGKQSVSKRMR